MQRKDDFLLILSLFQFLLIFSIIQLIVGKRFGCELNKHENKQKKNKKQNFGIQLYLCLRKKINPKILNKGKIKGILQETLKV